MELHEKLSGAIITFNEEKNIQEVLECFDFCDEIIVVDSFSTDRTVEIARQNPKVKIIQHVFEDFTTQRNLALNAAKNDWILFLDGDERITPQLKSEIVAEMAKPEKSDAYYFYRKFFFEGKPIHFSGTQTDKNFRLFRKSKCHYKTDRKVHETLEVNGKIGSLKNKLLHYSVTDYASYRDKMKHYGQLKGEELYEKGKRYSIFVQYGKSLFKFIKTYFLRFGVLDGKEGFKIAALQTLNVFWTYSALREKEKKQ